MIRTRLLHMAVFAGCCFLFFFQETAVATDHSKQIRKLNRSLFEFRRDFLELKDSLNKKEEGWKQQLEQSDLLLDQLRSENKQLNDQVEQLLQKINMFEEQLEKSSATKFQLGLDDLAKFTQSLLLKSLGADEDVDALLLDVINRPKSLIPKDLLLLYLARHNQEKDENQNSLGYYGNILTEFPDSIFQTRAIFEMSEIFGKIGKAEEQKTLLLQLSTLEVRDNYTRKAVETLKQMGETPPEPVTDGSASTGTPPGEAVPDPSQEQKPQETEPNYDDFPTDVEEDPEPEEESDEIIDPNGLEFPIPS